MDNEYIINEGKFVRDKILTAEDVIKGGLNSETKINESENGTDDDTTPANTSTS